jgi:regulator of protease activity HflC (stomatin/prohibitin superfamily)
MRRETTAEHALRVCRSRSVIEPPPDGLFVDCQWKSEGVKTMLKRIKIRRHEIGLRFHNDEIAGRLAAGAHWLFDPLARGRVEIFSRRDPWLVHEQLDLIAASGVLDGLAVVVDLKDHERGLAWVDGRFQRILSPGLYAYWTGYRDVRVELIDAREPRFAHKELATILKSPSAALSLDVRAIERDRCGVLFVDGRAVDTLGPGQHAFWRGAAQIVVHEVDRREQTLDISGQEIMTADKVTLRVNALVTYRVTDPRLAASASDDARQALYRQAQLALREAVGARDLDAFLTDKDAPLADVRQALAARAEALGLAVVGAGIRDVILPGEMRDLFNKVTEAKQAAQANLISRREETAAMRSQANTAKLLTENPTLMRLREIEALEKIALAGRLKVVLGEKGLTDKVVNLL